MRFWVFSFFLFAPVGVVSASPLCVQDDIGRSVCLGKNTDQAVRVVTLSPHLTEMVAFLGQQKRIVAVDSASDFPAAVKALPKVGDYLRVDLERVVALHPDLVLAWGSGSSPEQLESLRKLGLTVFVSEPLTLDLVASNMERIAILMGRPTGATTRINRWKVDFQALRQQYAKAAPVRVFYQVWHQPLMTLSGKHVVSEVMRVCGGRNVFGDLPVLAPTVSVESVLKANPDVIFGSGGESQQVKLKRDWAPWPQLKAVQAHHVGVVPPDILVRNGPRLFDAAQAVCKLFDQARRAAP